MLFEAGGLGKWSCVPAIFDMYRERSSLAFASVGGRMSLGRGALTWWNLVS